MSEKDIAKEILEERIDLGFVIIKGLVEKHKLKLSDYELIDLSVRCGINLAIEKNKSYRMSKIPR